MTAARPRPLGLSLLLAVALALVLVLVVGVAGARAEEGAAWHLEKVLPPQQPGESTQGHESRTPVPLGKIGDIQFLTPNLGLLITQGVSKSIPPGVWTYDGKEWHELATVCGATDGRIAWTGTSTPDDFWTVSDGRPGQVGAEKEPPLEDNTLCHFKNGQVVASFASLAFRTDSYQPMHAAACFSASDCWFGGEKLPDPQPEVEAKAAFQLHWNGSTVSEEPYPASHVIESMTKFGRYLYQSVRLKKGEPLTGSESPSAPPVLHLITPIGTQPTFVELNPAVPRYGPGVAPYALDFLHLSSDEEALWGAGNPVPEPGEASAPSEVTVVRYAGGQWSQVIGAGSAGSNPFTQPGRAAAQQETVTSIAAEPGTSSAWVGLTSRENASEANGHQGAAPTMLARISASGEVSERQSLPAPGEGALKGPADKVVCPTTNDCWLTTTQGWLYHYANAATRQLPENGLPTFANLITFRPLDAGIPPIVPDAPPPDTSGLLGEVPQTTATPTETPAALSELRVPLPLLTALKARVVHGTTLELRFHLAVKARVRLVAKRKKKVVASTATRTLGAGTHALSVKLSIKQWPTKIELQTHALAPLPTSSTRAPTTTSVSTSLRVLPTPLPFAEAGQRP